MLFTPEQIQALARKHYDLEVSVKPLPGEIDLNFFVKTPAGEAFTLKIANPRECRENLEFQNALIQHLAAAGLEVPRVLPSLRGDSIPTITASDGSQRLLRLLSWIEGRCLADVNPHSPVLMERVGEMCGKLCAALAGFDHPAAHRFIKWDPSQAAWTRDHLSKIAGTEKQALADYFLQLFEKQALPLLPELRKSVNYNDANDYNILVSSGLENPRVPGVIDFGDAVYTHAVNDLAIAAAYAALHKPDPLAVLFHLTKGFHRRFPLTEPEAEALFPLIGARLLISVTCSAMNRTEHPKNEYLQISDRPAWDLLTRLRDIPPALARATVRHACGWEPCPTHGLFVQWAKHHREKVSPILPTDLNGAVWLDLSVGSPDLGNYADIEDAGKLQHRIVEAMNGSTGIGRYDEARAFYTTDAYEGRGNEGPEWRSIHIGLDIFMEPGTPVFAPLDGVIVSNHGGRQLDAGRSTIKPLTEISEKYGHQIKVMMDSGVRSGPDIARTLASGAAFAFLGRTVHVQRGGARQGGRRPCHVSVESAIAASHGAGLLRTGGGFFQTSHRETVVPAFAPNLSSTTKYKINTRPRP